MSGGPRIDLRGQLAAAAVERMQLHLELPAKVAARLRLVAARYGQSVSWVVRALLVQQALRLYVPPEGEYTSGKALKAAAAALRGDSDGSAG